MAEHANRQAIIQGLDAFNQGNRGALLDLFADDAVLHVPGHSPIAGTYRGKVEIGRFFGHLGQLSQGPLRIEPLHLLTGGDEHVVAIWNASAARKGQQYEGVAGYIFRVREGKVVEARNLQEHQEAIDRFWSA